jgi:hypothetical protein
MFTTDARNMFLFITLNLDILIWVYQHIIGKILKFVKKKESVKKKFMQKVIA